ncbi:MAG: GTPase [Candidatus Bruticola sp.]
MSVIQIMEENFDKYLDKLPPVSRLASKRAWSMIPEDLRRELDLTLNVFGNLSAANPAAVGDLFELLKRQAGPALTPLSRIAVVGPVNAGKSTLFNAIVNGADEAAEVSPLPGTTVKPQAAKAGLLSLIDTPGLDNAQESGTAEEHLALEEAREADFLIIVFDASRGITVSDLKLYNFMVSLNKPYLTVLNKMDLINRKMRPSVIQSAASALGLNEGQIHPVSAALREGLNNIILEAALAEPRLLGELGRTIKPLRSSLSWQAIRRAAVVSCAVALTPLPIVSFVPLTAIQVTLVLTIARIYDKKMSYARASELLATLGVGLLGRTIAGQLSQLGGPPGWAVSASIAAACTVVIGYSCMLWFESGIKPSAETSKQLCQAIGGAVLTVIKSIGRKKADRPKLDEAVQEAVEKVTRRLSAEEYQKELKDAQKNSAN